MHSRCLARHGTALARGWGRPFRRNGIGVQIARRVRDAHQNERAPTPLLCLFLSLFPSLFPSSRRASSSARGFSSSRSGTALLCSASPSRPWGLVRFRASPRSASASASASAAAALSWSCRAVRPCVVVCGRSWKRCACSEIAALAIPDLISGQPLG